MNDFLKSRRDKSFSSQGKGPGDISGIGEGLNNSRFRGAVINVENVSKIFLSSQTQALKNVTFSAAEGDFLSIQGPSGSGKSTLFNIIAGLITPTSGEVYFKGMPLSAAGDKSVFRRNHIGFVFQDFYLYPGFSVLENTVLPLSNRMFLKRIWLEKAKDTLAYLGMDSKIKHKVNFLSSGERQRVCIARALLNDPEVILADEPTGNLDSGNTEKIMEILKNINQKKSAAILMVTHDDNVASYAGRHLEIKDGGLKEI